MRVPAESRRLIELPDVRREATERRILEATVEIIESGTPWNQVGIRQIAERADISRTAFYDFFAGKNEVLEQLVSGLVQELRSTFFDAAGKDGPPVLDLGQSTAIIGVAAEFFVRWGSVYQAFLDAMSDDARIGELWDDLIEGLVDLFAASLDAVRAANPDAPAELPSHDVALTCLLMTERSFMVQRRSARGGLKGPRSLIGPISAACQMMVFGRLVETPA